MAKAKKFVTSSIAPVGRKSTVLGGKVHTAFENDSFKVTYEFQPGGLRVEDRLTVSVAIRNHGTVTWRCLNVPPSPEVARIHAGTAFRMHFGVKSGEPSDFDDEKGDALSRLIDRCPCIPE